MAYNWLGETGLVTLIAKIKNLADTKVNKVDGKGLSTNDYTNDEKTKLAGIEENANNYELPNASDTTLGGVKIGDGLEIDADGKVKVTAKGGVTSVNGYTGDVTLTAGDVDAYTKAEVDAKTSSVYRYKGSVATGADLPTTGNEPGDVWDVEDTGMNYAWSEDGRWDALGGMFDTSGLVAKTDMVEMTAADVNTAWNGVFS